MRVGVVVLPVILAALFIGLLIVIHEAGHYFAAKWGGMRVNRFSVGFGPVLYKNTVGETQFQVSALPLGGFVDIAGLSDEDGTPADDPRSYQNRSFWERFNAVLAGPVANYAAALLILWGYFALYNVQFAGPFKVTQVVPDSAAASAGLEAGDWIVGVEGVDIQDREGFLAAIRDSEGQPLKLQVKRDEAVRDISVAPQAVGATYRLGIHFEGTAGLYEPLGLVEGLKRSGDAIWQQSVGLLSVLSRLVTAPSEATGSLSGPIGIVRGLSRAIETAPVASLKTVAEISIALGLLNLLPIPALDGSRLLFLLIGAIRRRRVPPRLENTVHGVGFLLLFGLLIVVSWNDVMRWVFG